LLLAELDGLNPAVNVPTELIKTRSGCGVVGLRRLQREPERLLPEVNGRVGELRRQACERHGIARI
jgi:hypothetical protein